METPPSAPEDFRSVLEAIDQLAAFDDGTSDDDLRGNLEAIRAMCKKALNPSPPGSTVVPRRRFVVRTNCEYAIVIETTTPEAAMEEAEHLDFDKHWEKSWSEFEVEEENA